jgi:hypothetical protein
MVVATVSSYMRPKDFGVVGLSQITTEKGRATSIWSREYSLVIYAHTLVAVEIPVRLGDSKKGSSQ